MKKRPIYYDTETTGVKPNKDKIIEIAAFDPENDKTFCMFVNPKCPIPSEASAIHSITDDMVENAPSFSEVGKLFIDFCSGNTVLIAHNNDGFDQPFLEAEFARADIPFPAWTFLDSLKFARKYRPDLPKYSLQHLREYHGIESNQAHRALDDVIILHKVFSELIDDLDMQTILELMSEKEILHSMPFGKHKGKALKDVPSGYIRWLDENGALEKPDNSELKKSFESLGLLPKVLS